jgi:transposase
MPREQLVLFTQTLEDRIPGDHPVRILDEILDRLDWTDWEAEYHGSFGQPPIHPRVLAKVLLFSTIRRIRSSRQMEYHLNHSIDFMWLASGRTIDHVTLSNFRRKHAQALKGLYRKMVQLAVSLGVAKLSELCIDGSRVLANANRYKTWKSEKLERLLGELDTQMVKAMKELETADELDVLFDDGQQTDRLPEPLRDMQARREQLDEALKTLKQMNTDRKANGIDPTKSPAQLPKTDTDSRILPNKEGGYAANYTPMVVTETENGFIVGADVVIGNVEHTCLASMLDTISTEHDEQPERVLADTAYSTGPNLTGMEDRNVELLAPLAEPKCVENPAVREDLTKPVADEDLDRLPVNPQTKRFGKTAFVYDQESDCYYCPAGQKLPRSGSETKTRRGVKTKQSNYTCYDCAGCFFADRCRANPNAKKGRKVTHDVHEPARRRHRERMKGPEAKERFKVRQHYGETPFAVIKASFDIRRFLLRGIEGVQQEWLWACTAFNLKKLMNLWGELCAELGTANESKAA